MPHKPPNAARTRLPWSSCLAVGMLAVLIYLPTLGYEFTFDDSVIVERNPAVQELGRWKLIFFSDYWPAAHSALYRPLTTLSFAMERWVHGSRPAGFHLLNVILHAFTSALVLLIAAELIGPGLGAVLAAALFAAHPIHTEAVCGVVGRAELLSSALALCALYLCLRQGNNEKASRWTVAGISLLFFLALCSKENVVILPVLLLLWELSRRTGQRAMVKLKRISRSPSFRGVLAAAAAFLLLRTAVFGGFRVSLVPNPPFVENPLAYESSLTRILNAVVNQAHGLRLHVFPHPLIADYSYQTLERHSSWLDPGLLLMAALAILILLVWTMRNQTAGNLAFAASWYALAILPVSNIPFALGTIFGERLYYLPSAGFCLCVAVLWDRFAVRDRQGWSIPKTSSGKALMCAALAAVFALSTVTWLRNPTWQSNLTLFSDTVAKAPSNVKARLWLGDALVLSGNPAAGVAEYRKALAIYPQYGGAAANLLVALTRTGKLEEAIEIGEKARTLLPQQNETVLYNLALVYLKVGNKARFLQCIQDVLRINPQSDSAHLQLGMYYLQQERNGQEARMHLQEALRLNPDLPQAALIRQWLSQYR